MTIWQTIQFTCEQKRNKYIPQLLIGAGHKTHLCLLILGKLLNVPTIVLMKPTLPLSWFDLCIIPEHDSPPNKSNIIRSVGALNRLQEGTKIANSGLILIGGPSRHFGWNTDLLVDQIKKLNKQYELDWTLTTSRRTPDETLASLASLTNIKIVPSIETNADWLPIQLAKSEYCWVSQDSVSMIYEALTAGCKVSLLDLPHLKKNRITQNLDYLRSAGYFNSPISLNPSVKLAEADRCATLIRQRFLI